MNRHDRDELDQLLARGQLAVSTREYILKQVEGSVRPAPWWRRMGVMRWSPVLAAAGIALYVVGSRTESAYRAKGATTLADAAIAVECSNSHGTTCSQSEFLVIRARVNQAAYVIAYAEPVDSRAERIWFFSGDTSLLVSPGTEERVLDHVVHLKSVPPGTYRVHMLLNPQPLPPEAALHPPPGASERILPLDVVP